MLPDVQSLALEDPVGEFVASRGIQSVLLVPLLSHGTAIGLLTLALDEPGRSFTPEEKRLAETFAGDLAAAIENARLAELAQAAAVSEERGRIARDLHDSVTQTLYSASLIAEALPRVWDRNPAEVKPNLTAMLMLIRGALAEMRTLLFELRPVALEEASLSRSAAPTSRPLDRAYPDTRRGNHPGRGPYASQGQNRPLSHRPGGI